MSRGPKGKRRRKKAPPVRVPPASPTGRVMHFDGYPDYEQLEQRIIAVTQHQPVMTYDRLMSVANPSPFVVDHKTHPFPRRVWTPHIWDFFSYRAGSLDRPWFSFWGQALDYRSRQEWLCRKLLVQSNVDAFRKVEAILAEVIEHRPRDLDREDELITTLESIHGRMTDEERAEVAR